MEENDELMETETEETEEETTDESGFHTGCALLAGGGLTLAAIAGFRLAKKLWAKHKEKKELKVVENTVDSDSSAEVEDVEN